MILGALVAVPTLARAALVFSTLDTPDDAALFVALADEHSRFDARAPLATPDGMRLESANASTYAGAALYAARIERGTAFDALLNAPGDGGGSLAYSMDVDVRIARWPSNASERAVVVVWARTSGRADDVDALGVEIGFDRVAGALDATTFELDSSAPGAASRSPTTTRSTSAIASPMDGWWRVRVVHMYVANDVAAAATSVSVFDASTPADGARLVLPEPGTLHAPLPAAFASAALASPYAAADAGLGVGVRGECAAEFRRVRVAHYDSVDVARDNYTARYAPPPPSTEAPSAEPTPAPPPTTTTTTTTTTMHSALAAAASAATAPSGDASAPFVAGFLGVAATLGALGLGAAVRRAYRARRRRPPPLPDVASPRAAVIVVEPDDSAHASPPPPSAGDAPLATSALDSSSSSESLDEGVYAQCSTSNAPSLPGVYDVARAPIKR